MNREFKVGQIWEDGGGNREEVISIDDPMFLGAPIKTKALIGSLKGGVFFYSPKGVAYITGRGRFEYSRSPRNLQTLVAEAPPHKTKTRVKAQAQAQVQDKTEPEDLITPMQAQIDQLRQELEAERKTNAILSGHLTGLEETTTLLASYYNKIIAMEARLTALEVELSMRDFTTHNVTSTSTQTYPAKGEPGFMAVGGVYRCRNGKKTRVRGHNPSRCVYSWSSGTDQSETYTDQGDIYAGSPPAPHPHDLMERIQ